MTTQEKIKETIARFLFLKDVHGSTYDTWAKYEYVHKVTWLKEADQLMFELSEIGLVIKVDGHGMLSDTALEVGRKAIEDALVEWRDGRLSEFTRGNGLVIRERDGKDSSMIRFGPEIALRIGITAMLNAGYVATEPLIESKV